MCFEEIMSGKVKAALLLCIYLLVGQSVLQAAMNSPRYRGNEPSHARRYAVYNANRGSALLACILNNNAPLFCWNIYCRRNLQQLLLICPIKQIENIDYCMLNNNSSTKFSTTTYSHHIIQEIQPWISIN